VFDIIHIGHTRYLAEAATKGDILVVGLNSDASTRRLKGDKRPINTALDRAEVLLALESVDYVVIFDEDTGAEFIRELQPDIYFKGGDYGLTEIEQSEEGAVMTEIGGQVWVAQGAHDISTSRIIEKIKGL
jgi:D-beta-D-heptose 7-phosphate kinase/D-beta-D-heptose 1-phosphate adenosyltransferase